MARKVIQLTSTEQVYESRTLAIATLTEYIQNRVEDYFDGEVLAVRYYNSEGGIETVSVVVNINGNTVSLSPSINESDTLKIVESETEPTDKDALWLVEESGSTTSEAMASDILSLQKAVKALISVVNRHEHAFTHAMSSGDIYNSAKADMMAGAEPEEINYDDYTGTTESSEESESSSAETVFATDFELYLANTPMSAITTLYMNQKYKVRVVYTPSGATKSDNPVTFFVTDETIAKVSDNGVLVGLGKSDTILKATMTNDNGAEVVKSYPITFDVNEAPDYCSYAEPNIKHLLIKSVATKEELTLNFTYLCRNEMIWCEEDNGLYIRAKVSNGSERIVKINGGSSIIISGDTSGDTEEDTEDIMDGILQSGSSIASIEFVSSKGAKYIVKVNSEGELVTYNKDTYPTAQVPTYTATDGYVTSLFLPKLYINSVYCGGSEDAGDADVTGVNDEHSFNYCSHNFVELSNLTTKDINLEGLSLQYQKDGSDWISLPLEGVIKSQSTFLIRGAQCAIIDSNELKINVDDYDMEWNVTVSGTTKPIQFSNRSAKFYLTYGTTPCTAATPYKVVTTTNSDGTTASTVNVLYGYIDLVGLSNPATTAAPGAFEAAVYAKLNSNRIMTKYYDMDPVSQATKAIDKRSNASDWQYVDLTKEDGDVIPNIEAYTPRASSFGKDIFFNKTTLNEDAPTVITCTFGIQATDKGAGATRCFNWVSRGIHDEYIWIRTKGATSWGAAHKSFRSGDGRTEYTLPQYDSIKKEYTDGKVFMAHKFIIGSLAAGTYEYIAGHKDESGNPVESQCTEAHSFTVRANSDVTTFKFVQTSDQQGFNWDEYQVWKYAAKTITDNESDINFMLNTGDMTQNGNRMNEWIDYFDGKGAFSDMEEMATIGNNDLSPKNTYALGDGSDSSKINSSNITYFYTFELDEDNLPVWTIDGVECYVPSVYSFNYGNVHFMCVNSEIPSATESNVYGVSSQSLYPLMKAWCEKDVELNSGYTWNIAYCHEMPFTIITQDNMIGTNASTSYVTSGTSTENTSVKRSGSRINSNVPNGTSNNMEYWFSQFCQENNIRLVMGGHKHTQAFTWPLKENVVESDGVRTVYSMQPIIQVTASDLNDSFSGATKLVEKTFDGVTRKFPNTWFADESTGALADTTISGMVHYCTFELVEKITAPVYSMSQATGYKHTSNKELPGPNIPWERSYYAQKKAGSANDGQKFPFYTVWTVSDTSIVGNVKKINGIFNASGKFNVNDHLANLKKGKANLGDGSDITPTNGFSTEAKSTITILK